MAMKFISPTVHGVLDYLTAAALTVLPRVFRWGRPARWLHDIVGAGTLGTALITDYPLGVLKALPLKAHLNLDKFHGAVFLTSSALLKDERCSARWSMAGTGLFLLGTGLLTRSPGDWRPGKPMTQRPIERFAQSTRPDIYARRADQPLAEPAAAR